MGLRYFQISVICYSSVGYTNCVPPDHTLSLLDMAFPCACMRFNDQLYNAHTAKICLSLSTIASKLTEIAKSQKNNMNRLIEWSLYICEFW